MNRRIATSRFVGVSLDVKRRRWIAEVRAAKFWRQCYTEAEAVAHYNIVAAHQFKMERDELNNLWKVRPNRGYLGTGLAAPHLLDIDRYDFAMVDERTYSQWKDIDWFVDWRTGFVTGISGYTHDLSIPAGQRFAYTTLQQAVLDEPADFINGYPMDCRRKNLVPKGSEFIPQLLKEDRVPLEVDHFLQQLRKREEWERLKKEGRRWPEKQEPRDPRTGFPRWEWWLRVQEGRSLPLQPPMAEESFP